MSEVLIEKISFWYVYFHKSYKQSNWNEYVMKKRFFYFAEKYQL